MSNIFLFLQTRFFVKKKQYKIYPFNFFKNVFSLSLLFFLYQTVILQKKEGYTHILEHMRIYFIYNYICLYIYLYIFLYEKFFPGWIRNTLVCTDKMPFFIWYCKRYV